MNQERHIANTTSTLTATDAAPDTSTVPSVDSSMIFQLSSRLTRLLAWEVDPRTGVLTWSGDLSILEPIGAPTTFETLIQLVHPDEREHARTTLEQWSRNGGDFVIEHRFWSPGADSTIWIRSHGTVFDDPDAGKRRYVGVAQDITGFKQQQRNAELLAETQLTLETATSTNAALETIAGKVVDHLGLSRFAIGYVSLDEDSSTLLHETRRPGHRGPEFSRVANISSFLSPELRDTLATGQPVAISDVHEDPRHAEHRQRYERHGERAELMIPYRTQGTWTILLSVFREDPHTWQQHEIDLLQEIMERVSLRLEQSRASQNLRQSEDRYRTLFNAIDDGFCILQMILDEDGTPVDYRFIEVNPAFERHTGLYNAQGQRAREMVPNLEPHWVEIYGNVALTGEPLRFVQSADSMNGRWFNVYAMPVGDPADLHVALVFHDMTEERRHDEAIRQSESRLRRVTEIETVGILFFQQDRTITDANDAFLQMTGYSREDISEGHVTMSTITPPEWSPESVHATDDLFVHQHMDPYEREFLRKDGSRVWGLVAGSRISENEAVKFVIDITEARRIEQEQSRLAAIVESSADAIVRCEPDGTIVDANDAALQLYGRSADELIGSNITDYAPEDKKHEFGERFALLARGETVPPWETVRKRHDGSDMQVEIRMSPIRDSLGKMVGCSGLLRDIGERKRLEQAQEDFLAMASHDLRSPITVLLGRAQLMRRRKKFDESSIDTIISQGRRIERLTSDLQQVIHMESGKLNLERTEVDLTAAAIAAVERIQPSASAIRFSLSAPDDPVVGCWDVHRLGQIMDNLLINSVKYSPNGGNVTLDISTDGETATFSVTDEGSGISEDDQKQLFGRFYRSRESRQTAGLGLGLYITRMLVEAHGGRIGVTSTLGEGTTFTFHLPIAPANG